MLSNDSVVRLVRILVPLALLSTTYLYLYPVWLGCVFPSTDASVVSAFQTTVAQHLSSHVFSRSQPPLASFRLLVLADPQLEGDSSLPDPEDALINKLTAHWSHWSEPENRTNTTLVVEIVKELVTSNIPTAFKELRKRLDLFGNDYYLAHIYRTLHWWTHPTHVTVLGDLIGSQWVDDDEFEWRGWRYWNRVFAGGQKVEDEIMQMYTQMGDNRLPLDDVKWKQRIINIAGNHDIGYAGDISKSRMERFERTFGKGNWDIRFEYPSDDRFNISYGIRPTLHLVVLNSMLFDTPAMDEDLQQQTYEYLNSIISERVSPVEDRSAFTLLLTHVPLHKKEGTCVDAPFFDFWDDDEDCEGGCKSGGVKEQNHLSEYASRSGVLQSLFGMSGETGAPLNGRGRPGLILNGHDHEGCDVWHYIPSNMTTVKKDDTDEVKTNWDVARRDEIDHSSAHTEIREVTLRSMMGEYGGNAGLLSAWFDHELGEWRYDIKMCQVGVQHIWWAIHILDIVATMALVLCVVQRIFINAAAANHTDQTKMRIKATKSE